MSADSLPAEEKPANALALAVIEIHKSGLRLKHRDIQVLVDYIAELHEHKRFLSNEGKMCAQIAGSALGELFDIARAAPEPRATYERCVCGHFKGEHSGERSTCDFDYCGCLSYEHGSNLVVSVKAAPETGKARLDEALELLRQTKFDSGAISAREWDTRFAALLGTDKRAATPTCTGHSEFVPVVNGECVRCGKTAAVIDCPDCEGNGCVECDGPEHKGAATP